MKNTINILAFLQNIIGAKLVYLIEPSKGYWSLSGTFSITNLSRWVISMSKRRLERFYARPHNWTDNNVQVTASFLKRLIDTVTASSDSWIITADETVGKKSGKSTYGIGYNYSSKDDKTIKSVAVLNLSLTHSTTKLSLPMVQEQLIFPPLSAEQQAAKTAKTAAAKAKKAKSETEESVKKPVGRPPGSRNKPKAEKADETTEMAYTFQVLSRVLCTFLTYFVTFLKKYISLKYVVADGGFGNNTVAKISIEQGLHLISKLQYNSALYYPFSGEYKGGRPAIYGAKLDYDNLDAKQLVENRKQKDGSVWHIYHFNNMRHHFFDMPLNIIVIVKFTKEGHKTKKGQVVLFSTDLTAQYNTIIDFYQARFLIEFNFRDARGFFGLTNFKNTKEAQVKNVIGYAFFMVTLSNILLFELKQMFPKSPFSIQDLKAYFRAEKYLHELLNKDEFTASLFLKLRENCNLPIVGAINTS